MKRFLKLTLILFTTAVVLVPMTARAQFFFMKNPLIGKPAPDFSAPTLTKKKTSLTEVRDGKKAIVFFWATWCPHCRDQLNVMSSQQKEFASKGIQIILVDVGEDKGPVEAYIRHQNVKFDVVLDQTEEISEDYNIVGVPTFFFVNEKGVVKAVEHSLPEDYDDYF